MFYVVMFKQALEIELLSSRFTHTTILCMSFIASTTTSQTQT